MASKCKTKIEKYILTETRLCSQTCNSQNMPINQLL